MDTMELDNDARGWIMTVVSGIACVLGASIICVDIFVRRFPGKQDFRIQDNNTFLACSLSMSFGVMLFMALYSMLPSAKEYLIRGGFSQHKAGFTLIGCFVGGFVGIQVISRIFHQFLPSHVVDCDHSHEEHDHHDHPHGFSRRASSHAVGDYRRRHSTMARSHSHTHMNGGSHVHETTPLLSNSEAQRSHAPSLRRAETVSCEHPSQLHSAEHANRNQTITDERRPSIQQVQQRVMSFMKDTKANCDELGPCYGYSDPCGQECFKHLSSRTVIPPRAPSFLRTTTYSVGDISTLRESASNSDSEDDNTLSNASPRHLHGSRDLNAEQREAQMQDDQIDDLESQQQHHHHVPQNAFLSIGLQTSLAIALHKFPEGFITYTTNHANPSLGFNVFLAIFVHNITEGFAMALPLYMALNNRLKAMFWSFILGGLSQPFGAGIAALWFKLASRSSVDPDDVAYGCLFAVTAGIMASVALQLFVESLSLNHNRNLSIVFAFLGMTLLGISNAFTADSH